MKLPSRLAKLLLLGTLAITIGVVAFGMGQHLAIAQSKSASPFLPIWKLLSQQQKINFLSGYLHAWADADQVLGIAASYVEENPENAAGAIDQLRALYNFEGISPEVAQKEVDQFYSDAENQAAPLSRAISKIRRTNRQ